VGAADNPNTVPQLEQSSQRTKGDENVIEIQGTSKRKIPSNFCATGGGASPLAALVEATRLEAGCLNFVIHPYHPAALTFSSYIFFTKRTGFAPGLLPTL
jgi:hypothetical protein